MVYRLIVLLASAGYVAACGNSPSPIAPTPTAEGTYTLRTANGAPLPFYPMPASLPSLAILGDTLTIFPFGVAQTRGSYVFGGVIENAIGQANYTMSGAQLTLTFSNGGGTVLGGNMAIGSVAVASWNGSATLTVPYGGVVYVYRRP